VQGYGERLRTARRRRALELADVAGRLKIPAKELRALEWERPDLLPSPARAEAVREAYEQFLRAGENGTPLTPVRARRGRRRLTLVLTLAAGIAAAAGITVTAILVADGDDAPPAGPQPAAEQVAPPPVSSPSPAPERRTPPPAPARVNAVLSASRGDSWVEARRGSAEGASLYEGLLRLGDSARLSAPRIWLRLGAASNIDIRVNGKPAPKLVGTVEVLLVPRSAPPA
jgi:cytoskeleton protein RodZ